MLLVQGRGEMAVLPAVTAVLLHHSAKDIWTEAMMLIQGRREMAVLPAVTAVLLHHSAKDIWTEGNDVNTG